MYALFLGGDSKAAKAEVHLAIGLLVAVGGLAIVLWVHLRRSK
jgi:hypothetical protein